LKKLTFINASGGEVVFTNSPPYVLRKFTEGEGINLYFSKGAQQDGAVYLGNTLDVRDITVEFVILADSEEELIAYRSKINRTINPKLGEGRLVYQDDLKICESTCILNKMPIFVNLNSVACTGLISITSAKSFWGDLTESKEEIALWRGDFEFPLEITAAGIEMGHREPSLIVNVNNSGDVECGMRVEFKALATVVNPSILNVNTQEYIKLDKTMQAGELITVSTYFGAKKMESTLNGAVTNAFNAIDFGSTFLQLAIGDNLFRYDADANLDNLEVSIYYTPQYLGV